jgi:2-C-methyl-D-erythritol 4-phosphate cytidylyltransferase
MNDSKWQQLVDGLGTTYVRLEDRRFVAHCTRARLQGPPKPTSRDEVVLVVYGPEGQVEASVSGTEILDVEAPAAQASTVIVSDSVRPAPGAETLTTRGS